LEVTVKRIKTHQAQEKEHMAELLPMFLKKRTTGWDFLGKGLGGGEVNEREKTAVGEDQLKTDVSVQGKQGKACWRQPQKAGQILRRVVDKNTGLKGRRLSNRN